MEYRALGRSGLRVSVLTMGTMTFGGTGAFADVGLTDVEDAERQVDICLDAGVNPIDTADAYSDGLSEEILGQVLRGRRDRTGEQLADNLAAASLVLTDEERARLDAASALPLSYPFWHQAKTARDRLSPADLTLLGPHLA